MIVFESYFIDLVGRKASYFLNNIITKRPLCGGASHKKSFWPIFTRRLPDQTFTMICKMEKCSLKVFQTNSNWIPIRSLWEFWCYLLLWPVFWLEKYYLLLSALCILQPFYTDFGLRSRRNGSLQKFWKNWEKLMSTANSLLVHTSKVFMNKLKLRTNVECVVGALRKSRDFFPVANIVLSNTLLPSDLP